MERGCHLPAPMVSTLTSLQHPYSHHSLKALCSEFHEAQGSGLFSHGLGFRPLLRSVSLQGDPASGLNCRLFFLA